MLTELQKENALDVLNVQWEHYQRFKEIGARTKKEEQHIYYDGILTGIETVLLYEHKMIARDKDGKHIIVDSY